MAVYTKVSKVGIQSILSKYNVGKLIKYEKMACVQCNKYGKYV